MSLTESQQYSSPCAWPVSKAVAIPKLFQENPIRKSIHRPQSAATPLASECAVTLESQSRVTSHTGPGSRDMTTCHGVVHVQTFSAKGDLRGLTKNEK